VGFARAVTTLITGLTFLSVARADDPTPTTELAALRFQADMALRDFNRGQLPGSSDAVKKQSEERYRQRKADFIRRAWALAKAHPEAPEAPEALALLFTDVFGNYHGTDAAECDAIIDVLASRYVDSDAILPVVLTIWTYGPWAPPAGPFLKTVLDKTSNPKVKGIACFYLAKHQERLADALRFLDDPVRGEVARRNYGPENVRRLRALDRVELKREAAALYARTIKEHAELRAYGPKSATLGEQAKGSLFRIQNLDIDCTLPEIDGQDIDGQPMKLSDFRGKVVFVTFWASWCNPCMGMVPAEKELVERMKGRPFVMIGVNGDNDRQQAKSVSAKHGINWRSFWDGGSQGTTASKWGVQSWPTSYLVDTKGVIRDANLRGTDLDKAVESLVKDTEAAAKRP
jgi:thiol-disulfide isomerase/thioredoxin